MKLKKFKKVVKIDDFWLFLMGYYIIGYAAGYFKMITMPVSLIILLIIIFYCKREVHYEEIK